MPGVSMTVDERQAELVHKGLFFPEGARWSGDRLWFAEIQAARVSAIDESGELEVQAIFESQCSGLGFLPGGVPVVSLMREQQLVRLENGEAILHADLAPLGFDHINDIVTDSKGRVYVDALKYHMRWDPVATLDDGMRFYGFENQASTTPLSVTDSVVLVDTDRSISVLQSGLLGPNGLALTVDESRLIVAEWRVNRIRTFPALRGDPLGEGRLLANIALPDGICIDAENAVWVSSPVSGTCVRLTPEGGITARVTPSFGNRVTACALGGPELRTLYLTTDRHPELGGGAIEAVEVECPGVGL